MLRFVLSAALATMLSSTALGQIEGWTKYSPGGATLCARGTPYSFFVNAGDPEKVIIDFIGGGGCWNAETCDVDTATFTASIEELEETAREGLYGVYDKRNAANPYRGWTHVIVPYCTGDVHWGNADVTYTRPNGTRFVIHHRGAVNVKAVMDWVKEHYPAPRKVLSTGCSAGSYGSIYHTPALAEAFPGAEIRQFGDSGVGILTDDFMRDGLSLWNITDAAPRWIPDLDPARVDYKTLRLSEFYKRAAAYYPGIQFSQYNTTYDFIQRLFYVRMGGDPDTWSTQMHQSLASIHDTTPNFRSYVAPANAHCVTVDDDLYFVSSNGVRMADWLQKVVDYQDPGNVACTDCGEP